MFELKSCYIVVGSRFNSNRSVCSYTTQTSHVSDFQKAIFAILFFSSRLNSVRLNFSNGFFYCADDFNAKFD